MDVQVGDVIQTKKPHPCGANRFDVLRVGMDFKIKCQGCGHEIMLPRAKIERNIKKFCARANSSGLCTTYWQLFGRVWNPPLRVRGDALHRPGTWRQP